MWRAPAQQVDVIASRGAFGIFVFVLASEEAFGPVEAAAEWADDLI